VDLSNEYERERDALASKLRDLRKHASLTGQELAAEVGMSQSKISKIETGRLVPSIADVERILEAVHAPKPQREDVLAHANTMLTEFSSYRLLHRRGLHIKQAEIRQLEEESAVVRVFNQSLVPGLLQTADYAREIIRRSAFISEDAVGRTVTARLERQTLLYEEGRRFVFVVLESALHHRYASKSAMRAQLDRMEALSSLPAVDLAIVSREQVLPYIPHNDYTIYDDASVAIETSTHHNVLTDERDVREYLRLFDAFRAVADSGDAARAILRRAAGAFAEDVASAA
jgi:transcriptional regulator with XRE-family HTH domain